MPWDIILKKEGAPALGTPDDIEKLLKAALPEVELYRQPSSMDRLRAMEESGMDVPDFMRKGATEDDGQWGADIEGNEFTVEFYFGNSPEVTTIHAEVRGSGNPACILKHIRDTTGLLPHEETGNLIDLDSGEPQGWGAFKQWRDKIISEQSGA